MNQLPEKLKSLIQTIRSECKASGVKVVLTKKKIIKDGFAADGFFDSGIKLLAADISGGIDEWLPVLVHEYMHFIQWRDKKSFYNKHTPCVATDLWEWLGGAYLRPASLDKLVRDTVTVEYDCEIMTVAFMKKHKLDEYVNIPNYIRASIGYCLLYHAMRATRSWVRPGDNILERQDLTGHLPTVFGKINILRPRKKDLAPLLKYFNEVKNGKVDGNR